MPCDGFRIIEIPVLGMNVVRFILRRMDGKKPSPSVGVANEPIQTSSSSPSLSPVRRLTTVLRMRYGIFASCRMPEHHDLWALRSLPVVCDQEWDMVISTGGPYSTHIVGYILKRRKLTKSWVVDWRDLWTDNHIFPGLPGLRIVERYIEYSFHRQADVVTTVSEPLADRLRNQVGTKVQVIYNGFDPDDYDTLADESIFPADNVFRIVYTGTIYPGKQDPTPLFQAIKILASQRKLSPERLQVIFAGHNIDVPAIAQQEGVERYVQYAGLVPRQDALRMQRDADALLFLEYEAPGIEGILTGKLFEYLFVQIPIIAVGISEDSAAGCIIERTGSGHAYGKDTKRLTDALLQMLEANAKSQRDNQSELHPEIQQFSRAAQAEKLLALVGCT
jgi:glycosyltransferase involved in cell wall biosynthesis